MLIIYLLEGNEEYGRRADELLARFFRRRDRLFTSYLALGEIMAGAQRSPRPQDATQIRDTLEEMGFSFLPFDKGAVVPFSRLRARERLKAPDAIHLACAASAGIDLFLTGDKQLMKLDIPGIQFIADFNSPIM
jgi:predicted nucleic acid-binding protein